MGKSSFVRGFIIFLSISADKPKAKAKTLLLMSNFNCSDVSKEGFPITYEIFSRSTFERHTLVPVIFDFIRNHQVKEFTVGDDAAIICDDSIEQLLDNKINYIVGAHLGNISQSQVDIIDHYLPREDGKTLRIPTNKSYLICNFYSTRFRKDKYEMEKQIIKAESTAKIIEIPS